MRKSKRPLTWFDVLVAAVFTGWVIVLWVVLKPAFATEKPAAPSQSQMQNQSSVADSSSVSGGGQSNANVYSAEETKAVALAGTSPNPAQAVGCYIPKKKLGRGWSALWGIVSTSAILERDEACIQDLKDQREYELAKIRAETQFERARTERLRAEHQVSCQAAADRAAAPCGAHKQ